MGNASVVYSELFECCLSWETTGISSATKVLIFPLSVPCFCPSSFSEIRQTHKSKDIEHKFNQSCHVQNKIYANSLTFQVTDSGKLREIFNGIPDWVYEGEYL